MSLTNSGLKPMKVGVETTPTRRSADFGDVLASSARSVSSSSTRGKGFNVNLAVSPLMSVKSASNAPRSVSVASHTSGDTGSEKSPQLPQFLGLESKYDVPLPPLNQLESWDIDEQLRLLALKEMSVVEIKDNIAKMNQQLQRNEQDLHKLRQVIQKSLYKELTVSNAPKREHLNSNPRDEAIASTRTRGRTLSNSNPPNIPITPETAEESKRSSKLWNGLSKPLNLLQQFDTMLQNEFEKSLVPNVTPTGANEQNTIGQHSLNSRISRNGSVPRRTLQDSVSPTRSTSPLKNKSRSIKTDFDQLFHDKSDDMFQSVSTSLWSFVHDVKTNVLSSLSEEQETSGELYNLETGSSISVDKLTSFPKIKESAVVNNSDLEDDFASDEDSDKIDLAMYANLRKKS